MMSPLETALALASEGLRVFPLAERDKVPKIPKWEGGSGCKDGTTDVEQIKTWWSMWPNCNVGVATGNGLLVVDIDGDDGAVTLSELVLEHGPLPKTRCVKTASGFHFWFHANGALRNSAKTKLGKGIDTRSDGGYVVAAGVHPSGIRYVSDDSPIASAPDWLVEALIDRTPPRDPSSVVPVMSDETTPYGKAALQNEAARVASAPEGTRNHTLNAAALKLGHLEAGGEIAYGDVERALEEAAQAAGLPASEYRATIRSGLEAGRAEPRTAPARFEVVPPRREAEPQEQGEEVKASEILIPFESWGEFRDSTPEHTEWLIEGILAIGAAGFLAAPPKHGKTWIAVALALSVASGKPFLGRFTIPAARPVMYFALEGSKPALRARFGAVARGLGLDPDSDELNANLHVRYRAPGINLASAEWSKRIVATAKHLGAGLIIIDVLRKAAPQLRESGDGATDFNGLVANLEPLNEAGCAIEFLHHFVKRNDSTKGRSLGDMLSGSGALFSHADGLLGIKAIEKNKTLIDKLTVEMDGRDDALPEPFSIAFEGEARGKFGGWEYRDSLRIYAVDDLNPTAWERAEEVAQWIEKQARRVAPKDICKEFGVPTQTLRDHRSDLLNLGITYHSEGRFSSYEYIARTPRDATPWGAQTDRTNPTAPYRGRGVVSGLESELDEWDPDADEGDA